jgi:hypothetical protein
MLHFQFVEARNKEPHKAGTLLFIILTGTEAAPEKPYAYFDMAAESRRVEPEETAVTR